MRISDWSSDVCSSDLEELIFEAGNQIAGTDDNGHPLARTTFKGLAIDLADEVHDDLVAVLGFMPFRRGFVALLLRRRSEEHTSELQSLMRISYAVFCLKKKNKQRLLGEIYNIINNAQSPLL